MSRKHSQQPASNIEKCYLLVNKYFDGNQEKIKTWFSTPNPLMGGVTPLHMLVIGRDAKLLATIMDWVEESLG